MQSQIIISRECQKILSKSFINISTIFNELYKQKTKVNQMAKKTNSKKNSKPLRRTSTMQNVVAQGEKYLEQTKKKRATKTRSMAQTIKQGKAIIARPKRLSRKQQRSASEQPVKKMKPIVKKVTKKTPIPVRPARKSKPSIKAKRGSSSKSVAVPAQHPLHILPVPVTNAHNLKKTAFKTKSRDHLPLPAFGFIDICFCIDATGSMGNQLAQAQSTIYSIIDNISNKVRTQGLTLRFAIVSYRDHLPQESSYVTQGLDFTDGYQARKYVQKLQAMGGGDFAQAVHDGLMHCCKNLNWVQLPGTPILRYIFHIADANPHGKQFNNHHEANEGCLCGMRIQDVYNQINAKQIHFRLIKARTGVQLNDMETKFQKGIHNFQSAELSHAKQMDVKVSDMIVYEVLGGV